MNLILYFLKWPIIHAFMALLVTCDGSKATVGSDGQEQTRQDQSGQCEVLGVVKDFEGLNACELLIETESGDRLLPASLPDGVTLSPGMQVRFSYEILRDHMSACMAEKYIIKVTCLEILSHLNLCVHPTSVDDITWIHNKIESLRPLYIKELKDLKMTYYLLRTPDFFYLYDCEGEFQCKSKDRSDECSAVIKNLEELREIYRNQ